jgi:hypothetical protein
VTAEQSLNYDYSMSTSNAWTNGEACQLPEVPSLHALNAIISIDSPEPAL